MKQAVFLVVNNLFSLLSNHTQTSSKWSYNGGPIFCQLQKFYRSQKRFEAVFPLIAGVSNVGVGADGSVSQFCKNFRTNWFFTYFGERFHYPFRYRLVQKHHDTFLDPCQR